MAWIPNIFGNKNEGTIRKLTDESIRSPSVPKNQEAIVPIRVEDALRDIESRFDFSKSSFAKQTQDQGLDLVPVVKLGTTSIDPTAIEENFSRIINKFATIDENNRRLSNNLAEFEASIKKNLVASFETQQKQIRSIADQSNRNSQTFLNELATVKQSFSDHQRTFKSLSNKISILESQLDLQKMLNESRERTQKKESLMRSPLPRKRELAEWKFFNNWTDTLKWAAIAGLGGFALGRNSPEEQERLTRKTNKNRQEALQGGDRDRLADWYTGRGNLSITGESKDKEYLDRQARGGAYAGGGIAADPYQIEQRKKKDQLKERMDAFRKKKDADDAARISPEPVPEKSSEAAPGGPKSYGRFGPLRKAGFGLPSFSWFSANKPEESRSTVSLFTVESKSEVQLEAFRDIKITSKSKIIMDADVIEFKTNRIIGLGTEEVEGLGRTNTAVNYGRMTPGMTRLQNVLGIQRPSGAAQAARGGLSSAFASSFGSAIAGATGGGSFGAFGLGGMGSVGGSGGGGGGHSGGGQSRVEPDSPNQFSGSLAKDRQERFAKLFETNPQLVNTMLTRAQREVGNNPEAQRDFVETLLNRSMFGNQSMESIVAAGYWGSSTAPASHSQQSIDNFKRNVLDPIINKGLNNTNLATDNASNAPGNPVANRRISAGVTGSWRHGEYFYRSNAGQYKTKAGLRADAYAKSEAFLKSQGTETPDTNKTSNDIPSGDNRVIQRQGQVAGIRRGELKPQLVDQLNYAAAQAGVYVDVTSGGQRMHGAPGSTGSHRHDHGGAGDVDLYVTENGKKRILDYRNPRDIPLISKFTQEAAKAGVSGVGAAYMDSPTKIHYGGGNLPGGRGKDIAYAGPEWFKKAFWQGVGERGNFSLKDWKMGRMTNSNQGIGNVTGRTAFTSEKPYSEDQMKSLMGDIRPDQFQVGGASLWGDDYSKFLASAKKLGIPDANIIDYYGGPVPKSDKKNFATYSGIVDKTGGWEGYMRSKILENRTHGQHEIDNINEMKDPISYLRGHVEWMKQNGVNQKIILKNLPPETVEKILADGDLSKWVGGIHHELVNKTLISQSPKLAKLAQEKGIPYRTFSNTDNYQGVYTTRGKADSPGIVPVSKQNPSVSGPMSQVYGQSHQEGVAPIHQAHETPEQMTARRVEQDRLARKEEAVRPIERQSVGANGGIVEVPNRGQTASPNGGIITPNRGNPTGAQPNNGPTWQGENLQKTQEAEKQGKSDAGSGDVKADSGTPSEDGDGGSIRPPVSDHETHSPMPGDPVGTGANMNKACLV